MPSEPTPQGQTTPAKHTPPRPPIHRVCITCNNMFATTDYDERHCPKCKK